MADFKIISISEDLVEEFWKVLDTVAREKEFLAFLEAPDVSATRDFILRNIKENCPHLVVVNNGEIIGWCDVTPLDRPSFSHIGVLGMGILKPYRGLGIGVSLLRTALQESKTKGLTRIELTVREKNIRAIKLYQKFGFVQEGFHKNAVKIDESYENHISMALLF